MRTKLAVTMLALVVLPTVVLSLLAGHVLRNWELILRRRLETSADVAIREVAALSGKAAQDALHRVRDAMADCLMHGADARELETAASQLRESIGLVSRVFLFMDPWGFIAAGGAGGSGPGEDALIAMLRHEIASVSTPDDIIEITSGGSSYCFAPVPDRKGLYAGYKVSWSAFTERLTGMVARLTRTGFVLTADGPGWMVSPAGRRWTSGVVVSDSLGLGTVEEAGLADRGGVLLASSALPHPFESVTVTAFLDDAGGFGRAERFRARLYGWGILLAALGILAGGWLVLREAGAEIGEAQARTDFMVGLSHDLRTPIASMRVLAESLHLGHVADADKRTEFLGVIVGECQRLSEMVEGVLLFMRQEQRTAVYASELIDMGELARSVVKSFGARRGAEVRVELSAAAGTFMVKGDLDALGKVLFNLLDNAAKYGRAKASDRGTGGGEGVGGGEAVPITVTLEPMWRRHPLRGRQPWALLAIRDYGVGIDPAERRKIFRRFYRSRYALASPVPGVGFGLALCKMIVQAHGGRMRVASQRGEGSTFSVLLPVCADE